MSAKHTVKQLEDIASQVRRDIVRMVHAVQSGHPGGSLGCADLLVALYHEVMDYQPKPFSMEGKNEDIFILSNGHISPVLYSTMARAGVFEVSELATFRKLNTRLQGHPATHEHLEGVRIASGSLGQGLSVATGIALSKRMNNDPKTVYCLMGDGELEEGQNWEAIMFAAHNKVDNLIGIVDFNGQQIDGSTANIMGLTEIKDKFEAFGWLTMDMDGNNMANVVETLAKAKTMSGNGKPVLIKMKTEMGAGVDFMMGSHKWHGIAPNNDQLANALAQLHETMGDY